MEKKIEIFIKKYLTSGKDYVIIHNVLTSYMCGRVCTISRIREKVSRQPHKLECVGSIPASATIDVNSRHRPLGSGRPPHKCYKLRTYVVGTQFITT